jgi:2-polyprenyl-3-methyl-5-hydroxy-6-metoxy-1,4-benzoquinol methylase
MKEKGSNALGDIVLRNETGELRLTNITGSRMIARAAPENIKVPHMEIVTDYPLELIEAIFDVCGAGYTVDEIGRDTADNDAQLDVQLSVKAYLPDDLLTSPLRLLDYGCGGGSSTLALSRIFPLASIVGMDISERTLTLAQLRKRHYKLDRAEFVRVPSTGHLSEPATFDLVFLNAVYEHLLPSERPAVLSSLWSALKPGGALILNQTPHRWFPIETHTSGLPVINYLPDSIAKWAHTHLSKRSVGRQSWQQMLREGIRGATPNEILRHIRRVDPRAELLEPIRVARTWAGIWYAAKAERVEPGLMAEIIATTRRIVDSTGLCFSPYIAICVKKS